MKEKKQTNKQQQQQQQQKTTTKKKQTRKTNYIVGSKIIWALDIIRVKKLIPNGVLWNKYLWIHDL